MQVAKVTLIIEAEDWPKSVSGVFPNHVINFKNVTGTYTGTAGFEIYLEFVDDEAKQLSIRLKQIDEFANEFGYRLARWSCELSG
jgi:hypothetical protein